MPCVPRCFAVLVRGGASSALESTSVESTSAPQARTRAKQTNKLTKEQQQLDSCFVDELTLSSATTLAYLRRVRPPMARDGVAYASSSSLDSLESGMAPGTAWMGVDGRTQNAHHLGGVVVGTKAT